DRGLLHLQELQVEDRGDLTGPGRCPVDVMEETVDQPALRDLLRVARRSVGLRRLVGFGDRETAGPRSTPTLHIRPIEAVAFHQAVGEHAQAVAGWEREHFPGELAVDELTQCRDALRAHYS